MLELETNDYDKTRTSIPQAQTDPRAEIGVPTGVNANNLLSKNDTIYGSNQNLPETNATSPTTTSGPAIGRASKHPTAPTAASVTPTQNIYSALQSSNPTNILGTGPNIIKGILILRMIDGLYSPAGLQSMASGALGTAFSQIASVIGSGNMLNLLNTVVPQLNASNLLSSIAHGAIITGISGMMTQQGVGSLSSTSLAQNSVLNSISGGSFGGSNSGLVANSLTAQLAAMAVGSTVSELLNISGVNVLHTATSTIPLPTSGFPSFTGNETANLATSAGNIAGTALQGLIGASNIQLIRSLNSIGSITLDAVGFLGIINNLFSNIQSSALNLILGGTGNLINDAIILLTGGMGSLLQKNINVNIGQLLKTLGMQGTASIESQTSAIEKLAIARKKYDVAQQMLHPSTTADADDQIQTSAINTTATTGQSQAWQDSTLVNHTTQQQSSIA